MPDWLSALLMVAAATVCGGAIGVFAFVAWFSPRRTEDDGGNR
jgi:hypothetical protein